jgi:hypothetical protein
MQSRGRGMLMRNLLLAVLALTLAIPTVAARTWYATPYRAGDAVSIQEGVDMAESGDTVAVGPSIYYEPVVLIPEITLPGSGPDSSKIDVENNVYPGAGPRASYDQIVKRLESGNLAINFARFRASFVEEEIYDPDDRELDRLVRSTDKCMIEGDWHGALRDIHRFLKKCKACPYVHAVAADAYMHIGQEEQSRFHAAIAGGLYTAMRSPGDGLSEKSAVKVLFIFEEYQLLTMLGFRLDSQAFMETGGRAFDVMTVSKFDGSDKRDFYFDVTWLVASRNRRYGWGTPSDEN